MKTTRHAACLIGATALTSLASVAYASGLPPTLSLTDWSTAVAEPNVNAAAADGCPIETPDGLTLLFASTRPGGVPGNQGNDIWAADRDSLTSPWQEPRNLGEPVNSAASDFCPTPVYGRWLLFVSDRPDNGTNQPPCGGGDIYLSRQSPAGRLE